VTALERLNDALRSSNGSSQYVSPTLEVEMDLIGDRVCFKPSVSGIADVVRFYPTKSGTFSLLFLSLSLSQFLFSLIHTRAQN
jgi:hypothetical protein